MPLTSDTTLSEAGVTPLEAAALNLVKTDPAAMRLLQKEIARIDPSHRVIPKQMLNDVVMDEKFEAAIKPLRDENAELRKRFEEKEAHDRHVAERSNMKSKYGLTDKQIDELAEWMDKDEDARYFTYEGAWKHKLAMMKLNQPRTGGQVVAPNQRVHPLTGRVIEKEEWRENFKDEKHPLRSNDRQAARNWAREEATKARQAIRQR